MLLTEYRSVPIIFLRFVQEFKIKKYTLGTSSNRSLRNFNILEKQTNIRQSVYFIQMYIILKVIPQIVILVDHLIEFLPRIKCGYPYSVKSHIHIPFISHKTKTTYGDFSFHSNNLIYQAIKQFFHNK